MMARPMRQTRLALTITCALLVSHAAPPARAANAGFLQDTAALAFFTDADIKIHVQTALQVLESVQAKESRTWKNSASGFSGRAESLGNFRSEDGLHCRKIRLFTQARGIESQFALPVCKNPCGEWFIASAKRLSKA
jgi:hypothetical protein